MIANLPVIPPSLPAGYCFTTWQQLAIDIVGGALVQFESPGFTTIASSATTPAASDRDKVWFNLNDQKFYAWVAAVGAWVRKHEEAAGGQARRIFIGSLTDLQTYDGGAVGVVGDASGPMWVEDTTFRTRFPLGAGTWPIQTTTVPVTGTGGEERHTLITAEIPAHTHAASMPDGEEAYWGYKSGAGGPWGSTGGSDTIKVNPPDIATIGGGGAHDIIPPYIGVYFIKRSARIYLTA